MFSVSGLSSVEIFLFNYFLVLILALFSKHVFDLDGRVNLCIWHFLGLVGSILDLTPWDGNLKVLIDFEHECLLIFGFGLG